MKTLDFMVCAIAIVAALALSRPAYSAVDASKATYNQSCVHCHGVAGAGNPVQDQFWNMKIPRLNEPYVQKKSDEALRNVILNGKRKMPAALQGIDHRTKVTPEQVPDLIEYIRSLQKTR
jgi:mono/diheme cytochrome c family protein